MCAFFPFDSVVHSVSVGAIDVIVVVADVDVVVVGILQKLRTIVNREKRTLLALQRKK